MNSTRAIVVFGDVIHSRTDPAGSSAWLRALCARLQAAFAPDVLAEFGFTQGDELQGLLRPGGDPVGVVLRAALAPDARPMRWAIAIGAVEAGRGPATQRTGEAFIAARAALDETRRRRTSLRIVTGDPAVDALLDDLGPVLGSALEALSPTQRRVAGMILVDGLRRSEVADRLGVSRATVSVAATRGGVPSLERLSRAIRTLIAGGLPLESRT
ncbi:MAG TPA: sigma factor-like helix-turn-helix DNA-binding protein [Candidatus Limnocylindrales bacterium]|nr:sigma factor-like helix-turn-helix DNA-binding protein [Candidatus Limnocylindrales bacterium]